MSGLLLADGFLDSIPPGPGLLGIAALLTAIALSTRSEEGCADSACGSLDRCGDGSFRGIWSAGSPQPPPRVTIRVLSPREGEVVPAGRPIPVLRRAERSSAGTHEGAELPHSSSAERRSHPHPRRWTTAFHATDRSGPGDTFSPRSPFRGCRVCRLRTSIVFSSDLDTVTVEARR